MQDIAATPANARFLPNEIIWFAMFAVLIATSCTARVHAPDDAVVEDALRPFYSSQSETTATSDLDVYVDGSMSMRGYVSNPNSNYSQMIREVLQSATAAQFNLNIYKFTSTVSSVTHLPMGRLQTPGFYDGKDTPLAALMNRIATNPSHTAIIVSDMVQSEGGVDSLGLVRALAQLAARRPQIRLLGYRSSFDGEYYPESRAGAPGNRSFRLTISQSLPGSGRPYYLFVVAPNAESMKRVDNYVLNRFPAIQTFNPTGPPILIENAELQSQDHKGPHWSLYSRFAKRDLASARRLESAFMLTSKTPESAVPLPIALQVQTGMPLRQPGRLNLEAFRATWNRKTGLGKPTQVEIPLAGDFDKNGQIIRLRLNLRKPEPRGWDVYFLKLRAGDANLAPPSWVSDWNTDNDTLVANGNRTFLLKLLVEAMENAITERVVFCEYILKVGRGD